MGRTDPTEPQCLYKGDLYLYCLLTQFFSVVYFNTVLNTTIYNYLEGIYIKSWQHVSVVHSTIIRP